MHMQEHGKRTAALIGKTAATLIAIHREAFQNMLASGAPSPGADVARRKTRPAGAQMRKG